MAQEPSQGPVVNCCGTIHFHHRARSDKKEVDRKYVNIEYDFKMAVNLDDWSQPFPPVEMKQAHPSCHSCNRDWDGVVKLWDQAKSQVYTANAIRELPVSDSNVNEVTRDMDWEIVQRVKVLINAHKLLKYLPWRHDYMDAVFLVWCRFHRGLCDDPADKTSWREYKPLIQANEAPFYKNKLELLCIMCGFPRSAFALPSTVAESSSSAVENADVGSDADEGEHKDDASDGFDGLTESVLSRQLRDVMSHEHVSSCYYLMF